MRTRAVVRLALSEAVREAVESTPTGLHSARLAALIQQGVDGPAIGVMPALASRTYSIPAEILDSACCHQDPKSTLRDWAHRGLDRELADVLRGEQ